MEHEILESLKQTSDIKKLNIDRLNALCSELRDEILCKVSETGGHLASNLGAVELTVALHYVFDSPDEPIIWDVGHQCYSHKILTGRDITGIRTENGLSGSEFSCLEAPSTGFVPWPVFSSCGLIHTVTELSGLSTVPCSAVSSIYTRAGAVLSASIYAHTGNDIVPSNAAVICAFITAFFNAPILIIVFTMIIPFQSFQTCCTSAKNLSDQIL